MCFAWLTWYLHVYLWLIANILKPWGFYLQTQVSGFSGESGLSRTGDGTGWGLTLGTRGSHFPQGPSCPQWAWAWAALFSWPIQGSFIGVFRMRTHAPLRTPTPPKCFNSASGNRSSCFRSCWRAPFSQASRWRADNSSLIKCLENPPPWGQLHIWDKRVWRLPGCRCEPRATAQAAKVPEGLGACLSQGVVSCCPVRR